MSVTAKRARPQAREPVYVPIYCAKALGRDWPASVIAGHAHLAAKAHAAKVSGEWRCTYCGERVSVTW